MGGEGALWSGMVRECQVTALGSQFFHLSGKEGGLMGCFADCLLIRITRETRSTTELPGPSWGFQLCESGVGLGTWLFTSCLASPPHPSFAPGDGMLGIYPGRAVKGVGDTEAAFEMPSSVLEEHLPQLGQVGRPGHVKVSLVAEEFALPVSRTRARSVEQECPSEESWRQPGCSELSVFSLDTIMLQAAGKALERVHCVILEQTWELGPHERPMKWAAWIGPAPFQVGKLC